MKFYFQTEELWELELPDNIKSIHFYENESEVYADTSGISIPAIKYIEFYDKQRVKVAQEIHPSG